MKDFLFSDDDSAAADTAHRIDNYYEQEVLAGDPLMRFKEDKGMGGYISAFCEVVFTLARLIPYNSPHQDKLILFLLELRKLPPKHFKIWGVCHVLLCATLTLADDLVTTTRRIASCGLENQCL